MYKLQRRGDQLNSVRKHFTPDFPRGTEQIPSHMKTLGVILTDLSLLSAEASLWWDAD